MVLVYYKVNIKDRLEIIIVVILILWSVSPFGHHSC